MTLSDSRARRAEDDKLPFQTRVGQLRISDNIAPEEWVMKQFLRSHNTQNPHDVRALLVKRHTLAWQRTAMGMAEAAAVVADAAFCLVAACWDLVLAVLPSIYL